MEKVSTVQKERDIKNRFFWVAVYLNRKSATFFISSNYQHSTERIRYGLLQSAVRQRQARMEKLQSPHALECKGIQTESGNINREIVKRNMMLEQAKQEVWGLRYQNMFNAIHSVKNEVVEMIAKVAKRREEEI